jgi:hypothetical protein
MYRKLAVHYTDSDPLGFIPCLCGRKINLSPETGVYQYDCDCGRSYDGCGWIVAVPAKEALK